MYVHYALTCNPHSAFFFAIRYGLIEIEKDQRSLDWTLSRERFMRSTLRQGDYGKFSDYGKFFLRSRT